MYMINFTKEELEFIEAVLIAASMEDKGVPFKYQNIFQSIIEKIEKNKSADIEKNNN